jgi:AsmA protein
MSKLTKIVLGFATTIVVLFAALVVYVAVIVEPDDFRPLIVDAVTSSTGRAFTLDSGLGLTLLPCCSIATGGAVLGNPPGFADEAFARIDGAGLSIKLWPLLTRREVQIGTITLDGLAVHLQRLADGRVNWEFSDPAEQASSDTDDGAPLTSLRIDGVRVRDGSLRFADAQTDERYEISAISLDTDAVEYADALQLAAPELRLTVNGTGIPDGGALLQLAAARLAIDPGDQPVAEVERLTAEVQVAGATLQLDGHGRYGDPDADLRGSFTLSPLSLRDLLSDLGQQAHLPADDTALRRLTARGDWTLSATALGIDALNVQLDDTTLTGSGGIDDFADGAVRFALVLDTIDVDRYLAATAAESGPPPATAAATELPLAALADLAVDGRLEISRLRASGIDLTGTALALTSRDGAVTLRVDGQALNGRFGLEGGGQVGNDKPQLAGTLRLDALSPRMLLDALDATPDTSDPAALASLSGQSRWRLQPAAIALEAMDWRLDDSRITGDLRVEDFDRPGVRFDVDLDRLDLDAYLPPESETTVATEGETAIPVEVIRALDLQGRLRAQSLIATGLTLRDVVAEVRAADGLLRLDPLRASLYGGEYRGSIVIDATGSQANLTLVQSISAVQVQEVLGTWFDSDLLTGALSMSVNGSGAGNTMTELLRGLAADVSINLSDGVYRGADVLYELRRARAMLRNEPAPTEPASKETPIRALSLAGRMTDGVLQSDRVSAETPFMRLLGQGGLNLVDLALDYEFDAELLREPGESSGSRLTELLGNRIPLTLSGPLTSPRVGIDLKGMVTTQLRGTVEQRARDALLERLAPKPAAPAADAEVAPTGDPQGASGQPATEPEAPAKPPSTRDLLRRGLRDLLAPPPEPEDTDPEG